MESTPWHRLRIRGLRVTFSSRAQLKRLPELPIAETQTKPNSMRAGSSSSVHQIISIALESSLASHGLARLLHFIRE